MAYLSNGGQNEILQDLWNNIIQMGYLEPNIEQMVRLWLDRSDVNTDVPTRQKSLDGFGEASI